ncbi:MAG: hypothetical protein U0235_01120 [Polyangiaceae bacterium]
MILAKPARPSKVVTVFFALIFAAFTTIFPYIHSVNNPNENVRVYMTMAIVDHGTFRIDEVLDEYGYVNDMSKAPDKSGQMHLYSIKAPAIGLLGVVPYWVFTKVAPHFGMKAPDKTTPMAARYAWFTAAVAVMRFFSVQIPCFAFLIFYERFLRAISSDTALRLITVAAVGVGTNYLAYSLMYVSHTLFGVAAFTSFAIIVRERMRFAVAVERRKWMAFLAGLAAGFATLLEYQAFPVSCALAIYAFTVFYRPARLVSFLSGAGLMAGVLMFYQWRCYGNPLTPGHKMAENPQFAAWHQSGFFGMTVPSWEVFRDLLFSPTFGLFSLSPFLLIGLLAFPFGFLALRRVPRAQKTTLRVANWAWMFAMIALFVPISAAVNWRGGWTLGPRFYGVAPPFFGFGALTAMEMLSGGSRVRRALFRGIAGGLAIAGCVQIGVVGLVYNTFPESVTRPLVQMAIPLVRLGFVPHHAGELVGLTGVAFWYVVAALLALAVLLVVFWPAGDRVATYVPRVVLVLACAALGSIPAFTKPLPNEGGDGAGDLTFFVSSWEPVGRDMISRLREQAERHGPRGPCLWLRLARAEKLVNLHYQSTMHVAKAGADAEARCPKVFWLP